MKKLCNKIVLVALFFVLSFSIKAYAFIPREFAERVTAERFEDLALRLPDDKTVLHFAASAHRGEIFVGKDLPSVESSVDNLDFNIQVAPSPNTFQLYLQSLELTNFLAKAYLISGDVNHLLLGKKFIEKWIEYELNYDETQVKNPFLWYDHGTALRANNLIYFLLVCAKANFIDEAFFGTVEEVLRRHGDFLSDARHYTKNHNHGIFQDQSLLYLGYFLQDRKRSAQWIEIAQKRLKQQITYAFASDGGHVENSPSYQLGVMALLKTSAAFLSLFSDPFEAVLTQDLDKAEQFMTWLCEPDKNIAQIGDSRTAPYLYDAKYVPFGENEKFFPQSGYYVARENWNSKDATWLLFKAGYSSKTHKHADDLSFMLYSKGYEIFIDPGRYNYMPGNSFRDYLVSSKAHNTVVVDEKSWSPTAPNAYKVGLLGWSREKRYNSVSAFNCEYGAAELTRTLYDLNDAILIYDDLSGSEPHVYSQLFHLSEHMKLISASDREVLMGIADTAYIVRVRQLGKSPRLRIMKGDKRGSQFNGNWGSISRAINLVDEIYSLKFDLDSPAGEGEFITLITVEDLEGNIKLSKDKTDGSAVYCHIQDIFFDNDGRLLRFSEEINIPLTKRRIFKADDVTIQVKGDSLRVVNNERAHGLSYAWYVIDKQKGRVLYKTPWSSDPVLVYRLNGVNEYLIKSYVRSKEGQRKSAMIAAIKRDSPLSSYRDATSEYEYLNLLYKGHSYRPIDKNKYRFTVDYDYSLNSRIRWYVYRNGGGFDYKQTTGKELDYLFHLPGKYTVMYYLETSNGEQEFWNFPELEISKNYIGNVSQKSV